MGRFIYGDIEDKCWFAVQPSDFPDRFGVIGKAVEDEDGCTMVEYDFDKSHLKRINEELERLKIAMGDKFEAIHSFFEKYDAYNDEMVRDELEVDLFEAKRLVRVYADRLFGLKLKEYLENNDTCSFSVEC
jgi:hypothetical protein